MLGNHLNHGGVLFKSGRGYTCRYVKNKAKLDGKGKKSAQYFSYSKKAQGREFVVRHFAGDVKYMTLGFIHKNKDFTPAHLVSLMASSKNEFIAGELYGCEGGVESGAATSTGGTNRRGSPKPKSKGPKTIASRFKRQLRSVVVRSLAVRARHFRLLPDLSTTLLLHCRSLESTLDDTNPFFIRCIKPNEEKLSIAKAKEMGRHVSHAFDAKMVLQQLLFGGVMETVSGCGIVVLGICHCLAKPSEKKVLI